MRLQPVIKYVQHKHTEWPVLQIQVGDSQQSASRLISTSLFCVLVRISSRKTWEINVLMSAKK